ncbi:MAG: DUF3179 domain-containing (seleno)protein [Phycisphaerales bacterium]|nr:DUF3179 domain-containing (seleno)protein [Phycisphaerales bacterium]
MHPMNWFKTSLLVSTGIALLACSTVAKIEPETDPQSKPFKSIQRPGSVDIESEYDLAGLVISKDQIHTLLPRDAIPSLTDPELVELSQADWLQDDDRIIDVTIKDESVAVPLKILNFHEVSNMTVGGDPVAATYCPLCDSVTLVRRTVMIKPSDPLADAYEEVLDFGVSGALYNSNVLMYDRNHMGLWSQLGFKAVSGPLVGTQLDMLPVKIVPWKQFKSDHPTGKVVSNETGHDRPYDGNPYQSYFDDQDYIMVPLHEFGNELPKKTLGLGVVAGDESFFVPSDKINERFVLETQLGKVIAISTKAGVQVVSAPSKVQTVQSFYYSFSAFHPGTQVVTLSVE